MVISRNLCLLLFLVVGSFAAGCGPSLTDIAVTVENQVGLDVAATLTAVPSFTPYPTHTPYPTYTPYPAVPTYTPYPTYTSVPTDVPTTTYTPEPSATATATFAPTRAESTNVVASAVPLVDLKTQLLSEIDKTRVEVEEYSWIISVKVGSVTNVNRNIDCLATVNKYDAIVDVLVLDVSSSEPVIQNAYNLYLTAVNQFKEIAAPWTDGCRAALANGQAYKEIGDKDAAETRMAIETGATNLLRQAFSSLNE